METPQTVSFKIDFRVISVLLLVVIVAMLGIWRPWQSTGDQRKLTVTGEAELEASPDRFVFHPYFENDDMDATVAKAQLDEFGNQLVKDLESLGVKPVEIKLDKSAYDYGAYPISDSLTITQMTTLQVTVTVESTELAQKVQDYLGSTDAKGQLTPSADFSDEKRRQIEELVRDSAVEQAKQKADKLASQLDSKLGKVLEIKDSNFQPPWLYASAKAGLAEDSVRATSLPVRPGLQTISIIVEITYALR